MVRRLGLIVLTLAASLTLSKPTEGVVNYSNSYNHNNFSDDNSHDRHVVRDCENQSLDNRCLPFYNIDNRYECTSPLSVAETTTLETGYIVYFHSFFPETDETPATAFFHLHAPINNGIVEAAFIRVTPTETNILVGPHYDSTYARSRSDCHTSHLLNIVHRSAYVAFGLETR